MRVRGRKIWASSMAERRVLMALGGVPLRVPRGISPYMVARRLARAAASEHPDVVFVRGVLAECSQNGGHDPGRSPELLGAARGAGAVAA